MAYFEIVCIEKSLLIQINIPQIVFGKRWALNTTVLNTRTNTFLYKTVKTT